MANCLPHSLAAIAIGAPLLASVFTYCFGRTVSPSRRHWPALAGAVLSLAVGITAAILLRDNKLLPADPIVLFRWMTVPGGDGVLSILCRFDGISVAFLVANGLASLVVIGSDRLTDSVEDARHRLRLLAAVSFLQSTAVLLLLARDWLTFFCCWQLLTFVAGRPSRRSSSAIDDDSPIMLREIMKRAPDTIMLVGLMLFWHNLRTFEWEAASAAISQNIDTHPTLWGSGICFLLAAAVRYSLSTVSVNWVHDSGTATHAYEFLETVLFVPISIYLVARSLPLLQLSETLTMAVTTFGAATAFLAALCAAFQNDIRKRLRAVSVGLSGFVLLGLGTPSLRGHEAAMMLAITQIVAMTAVRLTADGEQHGSATQKRAIYSVCAIVLASGFWGQQMILTEVAQQFRETSDTLQVQLPLVVHWGSVASLPCLSFALTRGYLTFPSNSKVNNEAGQRRGASIVWTLPAAAVFVLLLAINDPSWLSVAESRPLDVVTQFDESSPFVVDVGLPLALLGAVVAWLCRSTFDSGTDASPVSASPFIRWIRNGYGLQRLWGILIGWPVIMGVRVCQLVDVGLFETARRAIIRRTLTTSVRISDALQTGRVQFYLLSVLLATALLLHILTGWGM